MSTRTPGEDLPVRRIDRFLALTGLGLALLSVVCFFIVIAGQASGVSADDLKSGFWLFAASFPLFALPVAFLMIVAVLIMSIVRRARANRGT